MRDDELDRLIDAGLNTYADPRPGLDRRILANISAAGGTRTSYFSGWRVWAFGIPAAAGILLALLVALRFANTPPAHQVQTARATLPAVIASPRNIAPPHRAVRIATSASSHPHRTTPQRSLPKKDVFPTPQPLSPEMQALVQFAASAPQKERQALVQAQAQMDAPITVAPLRIAPLNESSNENH